MNEYTMKGKLTGSIAPEIIDGVRNATAHKNWRVETDSTWKGEPCIRIIDGASGRGVKRNKYLIVGPTYADAFAVLAMILEHLQFKGSK